MQTPKPEKADYYSVSRLRSNTLIFLGGKGINAVLSVLIFALIASMLPKAEFAIYAWLLAFVELSNNLSRFGINWAVDRYVPQLRSTQNLIALRRFILIMTGLRFGLVLAMAGLFVWGGEALLQLSGKEDWVPVFERYIIIIIPFAMMTFLRDIVFQSLLQQAHSQGNTTVRHLTFMSALLAAFLAADELTLGHVIYGDIAAAVVATAFAIFQLWRVLGQFPHDVAPASGDLPSWRAIASFAANSYANEVLRMAGSGYAVMTAAPHLLATAAIAPYGFCQTLFSQLNRFLPAHLFAGLYRPRLISQYTKTGSFGDLNRQLIVILKVSNYMLAAGIAVFWAYGADILALLSGGKYADAHGLMLLFLFLMLIDNHRQVLMALCNTIERVEFLSRASLVMLVVVPLAVLLVATGLGAYGMILALILADLLAAVAIVYQLRRNGFELKADLSGQVRIAAAAAITVMLGLIIHGLHPDTLFWNIVGMVWTGAAFVLVARILRPMAEHERTAIERMAGRRIYVI